VSSVGQGRSWVGLWSASCGAVPPQTGGPPTRTPGLQNSCAPTQMQVDWEAVRTAPPERVQVRVKARVHGWEEKELTSAGCGCFQEHVPARSASTAGLGQNKAEHPTDGWLCSCAQHKRACLVGFYQCRLIRAATSSAPVHHDGVGCLHCWVLPMPSDQGSQLKRARASRWGWLPPLLGFTNAV